MRRGGWPGGRASSGLVMSSPAGRQSQVLTVTVGQPGTGRNASDGRTLRHYEERIDDNNDNKRCTAQRCRLQEEIDCLPQQHQQ